MEKTHDLKWTVDDEEVVIDYHTSYIGDHFFEEVLLKETTSK